MSAPKFLSNALNSTIGSLSGGETASIEGTLVPAVIEATTESEDLVMGGEGDHRSVTILVRSSALNEAPPKGGSVTLRGREWQIADVQYHPLTSTRLTLESPDRREF